MSNKSSVSNAETYQAIGAFWDEHDATEFGEQADVEFEVNIQSQRRYYPIDSQLSSKVKQVAQERGISEETLLNLWIQEKINQIESKAKAER
ncbi:MAG: hypothetical protein ETSY2_00430 [Candidatus Entotheonella gemina]|uniref:Uncharacterized protein n=1 Tax=Candidatus Entotheonella gemina TaxID=1429439 RepID=W4MGG8_9BACT|nr:MAG: hypothetical protein ETSY2_00430 [Candidatus Entotheonella gemina]